MYNVVRKTQEIGNRGNSIVFCSNSKIEAKEKARRLRKLLSAGEKRYYKITYVVVDKK
jgi:hypothetical protein